MDIILVKMKYFKKYEQKIEKYLPNVLVNICLDYVTHNRAFVKHANNIVKKCSHIKLKRLCFYHGKRLTQCNRTCQQFPQLTYKPIRIMEHKYKYENIREFYDDLLQLLIHIDDYYAVSNKTTKYIDTFVLRR